MSITNSMLAKQFNGCTSNCGSVCDYIVDLTDVEFAETIESLSSIGAKKAQHSLEISMADRLLAITALINNPLEYQRIRTLIDGRDYELEDWSGWYE